MDGKRKERASYVLRRVSYTFRYYFIFFEGAFDNSRCRSSLFLNDILLRLSHKLYIEMRGPNLSVYLNCMLHTNNFDNTRNATAWLISLSINYTLLGKLGSIYTCTP